MPQTLANIVVHFVFSTKSRVNWPSRDFGLSLFGVLGKMINDTGCKVIIINGYKNHVHVLVRMSKTVSIAELMKVIKAKSSLWVKKEYKEMDSFYWQSGYFAFSVDPNKMEQLKEYILNQEEHHKKTTFQEECRKLFNRYEVEYDEKYCWD